MQRVHDLNVYYYFYLIFFFYVFIILNEAVNGAEALDSIGRKQKSQQNLSRHILFDYYILSYFMLLVTL